MSYHTFIVRPNTFILYSLGACLTPNRNASAGLLVGAFLWLLVGAFLLPGCQSNIWFSEDLLCDSTVIQLLTYAPMIMVGSLSEGIVTF